MGGATSRSGPNAAPAHTAAATANSRARSRCTQIASASQTTSVTEAACGHTVRSNSQSGESPSWPTRQRAALAASPAAT